ncbi:MAG TPA: phosphatidylinositol mannoside acyltransferase, partial [Streptosporangiaceae bacterium]
RLPQSWVRFAFSAVTEIAWRRQGHGVQVLEGNLLRVLGPGTSGKELRTASRAAMQSYGRYWMEVFRLPTFSQERILQMEANPEAIRALDMVKGGRGVIFALPHMGNWELAGAWVVANGVKFTTVAERLNPEAVFDMFVAFRESLGMEVLPLTGGPNAFGVLAQRLRTGHMVCLLCDRDLTESGVEVDFFGEKARMAAGPAALAVQTGASLRAVSLWFTEDGWGADVSAEIPVPAEGDRRAKTAVMTQELARAFEKGITEHPDDWHMLQRVFTADLDPARLAAPAAEAALAPGDGPPGDGAPGSGAPDSGAPDSTARDAGAGL